MTTMTPPPPPPLPATEAYLMTILPVCTSHTRSVPSVVPAIRRPGSWKSKHVTSHVDSAWTWREQELVITKTSGNLGRNQQRKGIWDRLERQDKYKCRNATIVAVRAASYTAIALPRHFYSFSLESCPSKRSHAPLRY